MKDLENEITELKTDLNKRFDQFTKLIAITAENTELKLTGEIIKR